MARSWPAVEAKDQGEVYVLAVYVTPARGHGEYSEGRPRHPMPTANGRRRRGSKPLRRLSTTGGSGTATGSAPAVVRYAAWKAAISAAADWRETVAAGGERCLVGLPGLAGDVGVGRDRTFGGGQQGEGLQGHLGGEQAGALGLALEADRAVAVLVAVVVEQPAGQLHRGRLLGAVELRGAEGGADEGADDPLQVDLQRLLVQRRPECLGAWVMCSWVASRMPS